ncbi:MAG: o-succinylbenzoate synthase [candidate division Zixibacteria bacterium]|nr:o-succinylbenzoate synthase [candidate division Zixibacteria bacterium]
MKIATATVHSYRLALTRPLVLGGRPYNHREGLIVEISDEVGNCGIGEVAPLPAFSQESLDEAARAVKALLPRLVGRELPTSVEMLREVFNSSPASVRFGIETAVLYLMALQQGVAVCQLLSRQPHARVPVQGLLTGDVAGVLETTEALLNNGYATFKLKVGRENMREDVDLVRQVRTLVGKTALLRLDANRSWQVREACFFAGEVADQTIEYIEEPVKSLPMLKTMLDRRGFVLPVALDESLQEIQPAALTSVNGVEAVVLKPTMLGLSRALEFARAAAEMEIRAIVSSSFETGVGLTALAHLAAALNKSVTPAGLDTLGWFSEDLLDTPLAVSDGGLDISKLPVCPELRRHLLKEVRGGD